MSSVVEVAQVCNLTVRRIQQLAREGVLPREAHGEYDLVACMQAYIRYLQAAMSTKLVHEARTDYGVVVTVPAARRGTAA
jgi:hypothetical protein